MESRLKVGHGTICKIEVSAVWTPRSDGSLLMTESYSVVSGSHLGEGSGCSKIEHL